MEAKDEMSIATRFTDATALKSAKVVPTKADMVGMGLSGLCMVHCLVFPLLVSFAPAILRGLPGDDATHRLGYKVHRKGWILALFLLGIALISAAAALGEPVLSAYGETGITVCGSLLLITAHWCNRSFCNSCAIDSCHQERSVTNAPGEGTASSDLVRGLTDQ
jgi:hypothetical protein